MATLSERIRELRNDKNISQDDLAKAVGLSKNTIYSYENGKRTPDANTIVMLADYFRVSADYLLGLIDIPTPSIEKQAINKSIGLSEKTIDMLYDAKKDGNVSFLGTVNRILESMKEAKSI